jgi:hypothetical protein
MAFTKTKANFAAVDATRAIQEGRTVFVYRYNVPFSSSSFSGSVSGVAEVIETIEAKGWALTQMAYYERQSSNGTALMLFRRSNSAGRYVLTRTLGTGTNRPPIEAGTPVTVLALDGNTRSASVRADDGRTALAQVTDLAELTA